MDAVYRVFPRFATPTPPPPLQPTIVVFPNDDEFFAKRLANKIKPAGIGQ